MSPQPKRTEFGVTLERSGRASADGLSPVRLDDPWTPEHLVLLGLAQCSVASLRHHARRASVDFLAAAAATGAVARRDDGLWGFVEIECRVDLEIDPLPPDEQLSDLLARAERGCFIGASLIPKPSYQWTVNGEEAR